MITNDQQLEKSEQAVTTIKALLRQSRRHAAGGLWENGPCLAARVAGARTGNPPVSIRPGPARTGHPGKHRNTVAERLDCSPRQVWELGTQLLTEQIPREYKAVFVVGDAEISQFSDEIVINWAPLA